MNQLNDEKMNNQNAKSKLNFFFYNVYNVQLDWTDEIFYF